MRRRTLLWRLEAVNSQLEEEPTFGVQNLERPAIVMNPKVHPFSHQLCIANFGARAPLNLFEGSPRRRRP